MGLSATAEPRQPAVTNVRNVASPYWRGWLKPEFRCLVPVTSFCEYTDSQPKVPHWFALGAERTPIRVCRYMAALDRHPGHQGRAGGGEHFLFSFLTTEANDVVRPIHARRCRCC